MSRCIQPEILQRVCEKNISIFNRGYIGLVLQLHEHHTWIMTEVERKTGTFFRISGDIRNLYRSYNLENGYMVLQHIILNIEQMLDVEDKFDSKRAGFSMAITQYTYASIQAVTEPLRTRLFHYILENQLRCQETLQFWPPDKLATAMNACEKWTAQ